MGVGGATRAFAVVASGLFGLAIGSFLNVVIYRAPRGMSLAFPASHCPACGSSLSAAENVPILSWLVLRGRCRHCDSPISLRYPAVEVLTAALFAGLAAVVGAFAALPSLLVVGAAGIAAAGTDFDGLAVPTSVAATTGVGALTLIVVSVALSEPGRIGAAALGAAATGLAVAVGRRPRVPSGAAVVIVTALAWSVGWLWWPGGLIVAATAALFGATRRSPYGWLWPVVTSALALLVVGAAIGTP